MNNHFTASELRAMAFRILDMADQLAGSQSAFRFSETRAAVSPSELAAEAARVYALRRQREEVLPNELFGEPAWDMLLDLFINATRNREISTTSLCIASSVNTTTALRWIGILRECDLLASRQSTTDKRVSYISMTANGYRKVSALLTDSIRERRTRTHVPDAEQQLIVSDGTMGAGAPTAG